MTNWQRMIERYPVLAGKAAGMVKCPCHNDSTASLSVRRTNDDALLHCFAGCGWQDLREALGLTFTPGTGGKAPNSRSEAPKAASRGLVAEYAYRLLSGDVVAKKRRWVPKHFDWVYLWPDGEWRPGFPDGASQADVPLYRLPEAVLAAKQGQPVLVVEGEKDVDTLAALDVAAVCNPEGASGSASAYALGRFSPWLPTGTRLILCPDHDAPGQKHANRLGRVLAPTYDVRVLRLPHLPEKGDVTDWVGALQRQPHDMATIARELAYYMAHAAPWVDVDAPVAIPPADVEAWTERASVLEEGAGLPRDVADRVALAQVADANARAVAGLTAAQRLMLASTDPALREIFASLA